MRLYLASGSPRRALLLEQAAIPFELLLPSVSEEVNQNLPIEEQVITLALRKAEDCARRVNEGLVLGADTVVLHEGSAIGKPASEEEARVILEKLSGTSHEVLTGIAVIDRASGRRETGFSRTRVWIKPLRKEEIDRYVATGEPLDKAGAYGIQGRAAVFVERIEGCYFNVVGLPLNLLYNMLQKLNQELQ